MQKRRSYILLGTAGIGLLAAILLGNAHTREPSFQGRSLTDWLRLYTRSVIEPDRPAERDRAIKAVQAIGSNAIPCLLEWAGYEPSPWRDRLKALFQNWPGPFPWPALYSAISNEPKEERCYLATYAFDLLGPQAAPAIPELSRRLSLTNSPRVSRQALRCLAPIGMEALPPITAVLADPHHPLRRDAANFVVYAARTAGTRIACVVPALGQCARDKDPALAMVSIQSLGYLRRETDLDPQIALPPIFDAMLSTNSAVRLAAIRAVAAFGAQASNAAPLLLQACSDPSVYLRSAATNSLREIAPQSLPYPHGLGP